MGTKIEELDWRSITSESSSQFTIFVSDKERERSKRRTQSEQLYDWI